jgi:hypothetical protein
MTQKKSLVKIAFFQALGIATYCALVGLLMSSGNTLIGKVPNFLAPLLMLMLLSTSVLICGLIALYYPIILIFKKKKPLMAIRLIAHMIFWMIVFVLLILIGNIIIPR